MLRDPPPPLLHAQTGTDTLCVPISNPSVISEIHQSKPSSSERLLCLRPPPRPRVISPGLTEQRTGQGQHRWVNPLVLSPTSTSHRPTPTSMTSARWGLPNPFSKMGTGEISTKIRELVGPRNPPHQRRNDYRSTGRIGGYRVNRTVQIESK